MKQFTRKMLGVTLLEILLVLAIAAMIIVMSVRYYQSGTASQQANAALQQIQAITAAADGIAQGAGTYTSATTPNVTKVMPNQNMNSPWGSAITIAPTATNYRVTIPSTPTAVCQLLSSRLTANKQFSGVTTNCGTTNVNFVYTYNMQPQ